MSNPSTERPSPRARVRDEAEHGRRPVGSAREDANGLAVDLEHGRSRHLGWTVAGLVLGALMLWKLGTVGQWLGMVLVAFGAYSGVAFTRTLRHPAGTIRVGATAVELPRGLCKGAPQVVALEQVEHAYLLRRAVPWTWAAPVLVVEAAGHAFSYPRDWFLSEADQRRIVRALHARAGDTPGDHEDASPATTAGDAPTA